MIRFAEGEEDRKMVISSLARVEARSAVSRLCAAHRITVDQSTLVLEQLTAQASRMIEQPVNARVLEAAATLIDRYRLRALDAVQLGGALISREMLVATDMQFIASDRALLSAAQQEGFGIWDPMMG